MDPMPSRLTEVDALARADHHYLPAYLRCFFWGEYTPFEQTKGQRWNFSATNQLLSDFKKKMDRQGQPDWPFKAKATQRIAESFARFWNWQNLHTQQRVALIPVPPSKARSDPTTHGSLTS